MSIQLNETAQLTKVLTNCEKLRVLDIRSLAIFDLGVANDVCAVITRNSATINRLCLNNYNLTAPDTEDITQVIGALTTIEEIVLENCNISCEVASCLTSVMVANSTLKEVNFKDNNLQATGCITLAQSLTHISTLTILNIDGNSITDKGAFAIAEIISCNTKLAQVYLNNNNLQEAGIIQICASLYKLIGLKVLAKILKQLHSLKCLDISCNYVTDKAANDVASIFSTNVMLECISISGNAFKINGLTEIFMSMSKIKMLKFVDISNNCNVSSLVDHVVAIIENNSMLETLLLNNCALSLTGIVKVCQSLSRSSRHLSSIGIANNDIDADAASEIGAVISNSPKLEKFSAGKNIFGSTGTCVIVHALSHCSNLRSLDLGNIHMDEPIAEYLHDVICNNAFLQKLYLNNCNLTQNCFKKIAESLLCIGSLKVLSCENNNMYPCTSDLVSVLEANSSLQELHLRQTNLQTEKATVVLQSLIKLTRLTVLDISHNDIGITAVKDLASVLSRNSQLEKLYVQCNHLQSSEIFRIVHGICMYKSLRSFNFAKNDITGVACDDLAKMVANNVNIHEMLLFGNKLCSSEISFILNHNTPCLKKLDIGNNNIITEDDAEKFLTVCTKQSNIEIHQLLQISVSFSLQLNQKFNQQIF